jgi:non-specific serine/threonine protein kinase/serine/threonine-protein kinase
MDAGHYDELKRIFFEAACLPEAERRSYVDDACRHDPELGARVRELLETLAPRAPRVARDATAFAPSRERDRIGPYLLVEKLGEGGMGTVWRARQDQPVRREVAIKLLRAGLDTADALARFEAERQALALMNHPSIARVYDAGTTDQGRPFFAMELVRGEPITLYCDRRRMRLGNRLELFLKVCEGVRHAHQKAIVHRDLKPSNILVTEVDGEPAPKIIDFGVAKAMSRPLTDRTMVTYLGQLIGTPEYMSPEQASNVSGDVDTTTDVYSLGVMLYELLTGSLPFDSKTLREAGFEGIQRIIREVEPLRPSERVEAMDGNDAARAAGFRGTDPGALASIVSGDLDWIVMKALEKEPPRRYDSPSAFAADIRRYLDHQPIEARPPSVTYRFGKLLRRHRVAAGVSVILVGFLAAFAAMMTVQAARVARERDRAETEARKSAAVSGYLMELFQPADPMDPKFQAGEAEAGELILGRMLDELHRLDDPPFFLKLLLCKDVDRLRSPPKAKG